MIGKIIAGASFAGTVGYVMKEQSRIPDTEGVTPPETKHRSRISRIRRYLTRD